MFTCCSFVNSRIWLQFSHSKRGNSVEHRYTLTKCTNGLLPQDFRFQMLKSTVICKSELDINPWCKYRSASASLPERWIKTRRARNRGPHRKAWGRNMEIRQPVNSQKKFVIKLFGWKTITFVISSRATMKSLGPWIKEHLSQRVTLENSIIKVRMNSNSSVLPGNRRARRIAHFISSRISLFSLVDFHQNHACLFCFLSLDHRQVNIGVHIPLRPRKHHHHQRHHHHRRRHRSLTLDSKDEAG